MMPIDTSLRGTIGGALVSGVNYCYNDYDISTVHRAVLRYAQDHEE